MNVGEEEPRDGERLEIFDRGRFIPVPPAERGVLRLEGPRDEGGEAARLFLQIVDHLEVVDALLQRFAYAEHHGGGGAHAELVRGAMHVHPVLCEAFETRDAEAHFVVQDFGATPGDGIEPGIAQARNRVVDRNSVQLGEVQDLRRGKAMQPHLRKALLDAAHQRFVPLQLQVWMQPALHQDAGAAELDRLADLFVDRLVIERVTLGCSTRCRNSCS